MLLNTYTDSIDFNAVTGWVHDTLNAWLPSWGATLVECVLIGLCAALIALFCVDQAYSHFHPNEGEGITDEVVYKTDDARIRLDEEAFV